MIVDDNKDFAQMLKIILKNEGIEADFVTSGAEAVKKIKEAEYNILFLDLVMPDMDGMETLETIRASGLNVPAIIISGYRNPEMLERLKTLQVEKILKKPVKIQEIIVAIQSVLQRESGKILGKKKQ